MARFLALLLGTALAVAVFGVGWRILHPPVPMQDVEIHVTDARGNPIEAFKWEYWDSTPAPGGFICPYVPNPPHPGGSVLARVPRHRVSIDIRCKGLGTQRLGPFEPDAIPSRIDVVLPDLPVVSGVVTYDGKPVAGATVLIVTEEPDLMEGIPSRVYSGYSECSAMTDESGSFRIGSEGEGTPYLVTASKQGYATGTAGPVHVGNLPVEVRLHDGGVIEGTLRLADGKDPNATQIELYRTDVPKEEADAYGHFVVRADRGGLFRFEHVDDGPWLVRVLRARADAPEVPDRSPESVPFVVDVAEGETTHLEMDLTQPPVELNGQPTMNGKPWKKAYPRLHVDGPIGLTLDSAESDDAGRWTLRVRTPGPYRLIVWGNHHHDGSVPESVADIVEIPLTGARWDRHLVWGGNESSSVRLDQVHGAR